MKGKKVGGRTPGAVNKITSEVREILQLVLTNEISQLEAYLSELNTKDKVDAICKLIPYLIPRMPTETIINEQLPKRFEFEIEVLNGNGSLRERYPLNNYGNDGTEPD
jgi:hypothetical protein